MARFRSRNPHLVVNNVDWIQCRYLIVQRGNSVNYNATDADTAASVAASTSAVAPGSPVKTIPLDPAFRLTLAHETLNIPDVVDKLEKMEARLEDADEEFNASDVEIMKEPTIVIEEGTSTGASGRRSKLKRGASSLLSPSKTKDKPLVTFVPCDDERLSLVKLLPPPKTPSRSAMITIQREMRAMMDEQSKIGSVAAGFYFDPVRYESRSTSLMLRADQPGGREIQERSNDNLFTWVIELPVESFDTELPLVK